MGREGPQGFLGEKRNVRDRIDVNGRWVVRGFFETGRKVFGLYKIVC